MPRKAGMGVSKSHYDIVVVGAGPAGMAAATLAAEHGARVLLLDEQNLAGGLIYRAVSRQSLQDAKILGPEYYQGQVLINELASSDVEHVPGATVWQVTADRQLGVSVDGSAQLISADEIILATGAQERPFPIPGWTLPGVMGAGGAQVLLKSSGLAMQGAVFAGSGPLLYLIAHQYLQAGIAIRAILDTSPKGNSLRALPHLPAALMRMGLLRKGHAWKSALRAAGIAFIAHVQNLQCQGEEALRRVDYQRDGAWHHIDTPTLFLHQGVVPNNNLAMAAGCDHRWSGSQLCWHAVTDIWFQSNLPGIAIAGDGGTIHGAQAAQLQGQIAALGALVRCAKLSATKSRQLAQPYRRELAAEQRIRPFLDALFRPARQFRIPADDSTMVCRCEEVTAAQVRDTAAQQGIGPNQLKGMTRSAMGPCQGRFCGLTLCELIAESRNVPVSEVGPLRLRAPIKPLRLNELAALTQRADGNGTGE